MNWAIFHEQVFPIRHKLFRFALRITGSRHDAEDVVQEVLEKVWKTPENPESPVLNWEAWCMALTRNRSVDKKRSNSQIRVKPLDGLAEAHDPARSPALRAETHDMAARVRQFIDGLPEKQRLVMFLRDVEDLTYEEIAHALDISLDQVKVTLHRARKSVRAQLLRFEGIQAID